jgi:hypothetical protein
VHIPVEARHIRAFCQHAKSCYSSAIQVSP